MSIIDKRNDTKVSMQAKQNKNFEVIAISVITIGFVIWGALFIYRSSFIAIDGQRYFSLFDDAMISMRYAWNLSHGNGLVWNPGEYVEGYTNLLMVLLMSLATLLFDDKRFAVLAIQISGILFMLGNAYLVTRIANQISLGESQRHRALLRVLAFVGTLSYYPLAYWSLMGMETGLLTFLLSLAILSALKHTSESSKSQLFLLPLSLGLAYLTRPGSLVPALIIWSYVVVRSSKKTSWRLLLGMIGLYLLFPLAQTFFRWQYYGELVPNTYTLKVVGIPLWHRIQNGWGFIRPFLLTNYGIILVGVGGIIFNFRPQKFLLAIITLAAIGYQIWAGGDPWPYWRMMSPVMPLVLLLFAHETLLVVEALSDTTFFRQYFLRNLIFAQRYVPAFLVLSIMIYGLVKTNKEFLYQATLQAKPYKVAGHKENVNNAIAINHLTTRDATIGVFWAGIIPYYTERRAVDFLGKADKYVAQLKPDLAKPAWDGMRGVPGHNKYDLNYSIKTMTPTYVQTFKRRKFVWGRQKIYRWAESNYVEVEYKGVHIFLHRDSSAIK